MQQTVNDVKPRSFKEYLGIAARGYVMGAADVVPGVSGGTMAFILGIYEELLDAIRSVDLKLIRLVFTLQIREALDNFPWKFLLALVLGIFTAILTLAKSLSWALMNHPTLIWSFFFGLVLASVFVVRNRIARWSPGLLLVTGLAALGSYLLVGMVPVETPNDAWFLFLSGAIAINAMILPGISGAFILVLLGKYQYLLEAVVEGNIVVLLLVISGALVGLITFARVLRWLFHHYHDLTVAVLIGLIIGALRKVWPWKEFVGGDPDAVEEIIVMLEVNVLPESLTPDVILAIALMGLGFVLVLVLNRLASHKRQVE
jgi:putative membrane protein